MIIVEERTLENSAHKGNVRASGPKMGLVQRAQGRPKFYFRLILNSGTAHIKLSSNSFGLNI